MGSDEHLSELVQLVAPEDLPERYLSQSSVVRLALELQNIIARFETSRIAFEQIGMKFGGRTLLVGNPGCNFDAFVYHIVKEVPLNLVRFTVREVTEDLSSKVIAAFEFVKRNAPAVLYLPYLHHFFNADSKVMVTLREEIGNTSWDNDEVIVICSTTHPEDLDRELISIFDRTYVLPTTTSEDRVQLFETVLESRTDVDPSILEELTDGWSFTDIEHLAKSILLTPAEATGQMSREQIEKLIEDSRVLPIGNDTLFRGNLKGLLEKDKLTIETLEAEYPEDFIDQLYLMAVGESYQVTQRVIETLNANLPLSAKDREFLSRHPYILTGNSEERLTRLLKAKKTSDRLRRVLGRQL